MSTVCIYVQYNVYMYIFMQKPFNRTHSLRHKLFYISVVRIRIRILHTHLHTQ